MNVHLTPDRAAITVDIAAPPAADAPSAILAILDEEHRLYRRMVAVAEAKRDALLANDAEALTPIVREMEGIALAVEGLEQERMAQVAVLAGGAEYADESFSALRRYFSGNELLRLETVRGQLREAVGRVRAVNQLNAALVQQALVFTDQWVRLVRASMPATYANSGAMVGPHGGGRSWQV